MHIKQRTLLFSATSTVGCSKVDALSFHTKLVEINMDRVLRGEQKHIAEFDYCQEEGLFISGVDFVVDKLADDICQAIANLLAATETDYLDVTYCVCTPIFHRGSHWGGYARIYRDGKIKQTRLLDAPPH